MNPIEEVKVVKPKAKRAIKKNNIVNEEVKVVEPIEEVKPKAKRAIKKNNIVVEDVKPVESEPVEESNIVDPVEEVKPEPKIIKTLEMVECEKCGQKMTKTTLRDHHDKNCPGRAVDTKALPMKRRVKKQEASEPKLEAIKPTYQDKLADRFKKRSESISKLALQIA